MVNWQGKYDPKCTQICMWKTSVYTDMHLYIIFYETRMESIDLIPFFSYVLDHSSHGCNDKCPLTDFGQK